MRASKKYFVGIEGGGTKSSIILSDENGTIISKAKGKATNPNVIGFETSAKNIVDSISSVCKKSNCAWKEISSITIGTAGGGNSASQLHLKKELQKKIRDKKFFPLIRITSDAEITAEAALGNESGIVLIAGTGSILLGKKNEPRFTNHESQITSREPRTFRIGGWGNILGDEGSGFAIARDGVKEVVNTFDRNNEVTPLTKTALKFFSANNVYELPSKIFNGKKNLASFAPSVIELALKNDSQSLFVVEFHCNALLQQLQLVCNHFPNINKLPLVLLGGLLENENFYSQMLKDNIEQYFPQLEIQKPKFPSAYGAILLSMKAK
jgi:N-acetylglucosamine kinase-like BadF-type ATPase